MADVPRPTPTRNVAAVNDMATSHVMLRLAGTIMPPPKQAS